MSLCPFCDRDTGDEETLENPRRKSMLGYNTKIRAKGRASFDVPPGDPEAGGMCLFRTPACDGCYATLGAIIHRSKDEVDLLNAQMFQGDPKQWIDNLVEDIAQSGTPIVRIHGFGDFFSREYILAWAEVVRRCPTVKFFGTTRAWLATFQPVNVKSIAKIGRDLESNIVSVRLERERVDRFLEALDELRSLPNIALGASVEGASYLASHESFVPGDPMGKRQEGTGIKVPAWSPTSKNSAPNDRSRVFQRGEFAGKTVVEYLRAKRFNIWNMLSEFTDPEVRKALGVKVASGENFAIAAANQFRVAKQFGFMVGNVGCPEQTGKVIDCQTCRRCLHKADGTGRWDINFAYHPGKGRVQQEEEIAVRLSWGLPPAEESAKERLKELGYSGRGGVQRYARDALARGLKPKNVKETT